MDSTTQSKNDNNVDYDFNFGNFNPENVEVEETINAVFVIDKSGSIASYVNELNKQFNEFVSEFQKSHHASKLFVSIVEFNDQVNVRSGFQPIENVPVIDFSKDVRGMTALYDGTKVGLENALNYREGLENAGVNCKTLLFVITDGEDNASRCRPSEVQSIITKLMTDERNYASFDAILFGIGGGMDNYFNQAAAEMGIQKVAVMSNSAKDIKKMINIISSSVSSSASGGNAAISTPNF
jgi:uncharacterized protein YegL